MSTHVLRLARTPVPTVDLEEFNATFTAIHQVLRQLDRRRLGLLVDLREGPMRNDPEFERALEHHRRQLCEGFACVVVLVRTATGKLQVKRHAREDHTGFEVFDDERAALVHVTEHLSTLRRSEGALKKK